jgi:phosphatidyl-myo-inositol alpha-mannosyltransferase
VKIGLVVDDTLDKPDGVQQYVLLLGKWLSDQGHEVHYLAGQSKRTDISNVHSLSRNIAVRFNGNKLTVPLPASRRKIRALLQAEQFDVLHVQMPYSPFMAGRVIGAAERKTAVVGTFHILPFSRWEALATRLLGTVLRPSLKKFSAVLAVSQAASDFARYAFSVNPEVIPNMVDVQKFGQGASQSPVKTFFTIAFLGRLVERKGAMALLQAVKALPDTARQNLQVKIGGKGELADKLQRYIDANNLGNIVRLDGFVAEADKPQYLREADIAVFPSLGGESFGIVLLEGMASGAGVTMGGDNPGYRSVLGKWPQTLVNPRDTAAFAQALEKFITDSSLRNSTHAEQQEAVKAYDVAVVGTKIQDIYQRFVA